MLPPSHVTSSELVQNFVLAQFLSARGYLLCSKHTASIMWKSLHKARMRISTCCREHTTQPSPTAPPLGEQGVTGCCALVLGWFDCTSNQHNHPSHPVEVSWGRLSEVKPPASLFCPICCPFLRQLRLLVSSLAGLHACYLHTDWHSYTCSIHTHCRGGTEYLSCTPGSHSVCAVRTLLGVDQKMLSIENPC